MNSGIAQTYSIFQKAISTMKRLNNGMSMTHLNGLLIILHNIGILKETFMFIMTLL
jgi:enolase